MLTLVLPGYSSSNKKWLEETASSVRTDGEVRPVYWGHWDDPNIEFDPKTKANLLDSVAGKRVVDVIAKSLGTLAASHLIQKSPEKIRKVIFCGLPLNDINEEEKQIVVTALRKLPPQNVIFFHNSEDPHGGANALKVFLSEFEGDFAVIVKPRSDHEYFYQDDFNKFLLG